MNRFRIVGAAAIIVALFAFAADAPQLDNRLWEYRNLGKAFYENPDTHLQAVEQLRAALQLKPDSVRERINYGLALLRAGQTDAGTAELLQAQKQDPSIPHTWFNLGIVYKHAGEYDQAIEQFHGFIRLVPHDAISHYNLGSVLRSKGDTETALKEFTEAERLDPDLAGPHFQLFTLYQRARITDQAARERTLFEQVKKQNEGAATPEDMEWNFYAELYDPPEAHPAASNEPATYDDKVISKGWDPKTSGMLVLDSTGSRNSDLLVWSRDRVELFRSGSQLAINTGLENLRDVRSIAAGDFDNDGFPDLCIVTGAGAAVYRNNKGTFAKYADLPGTADVTTALWLDYDHDYDLDILLFGPKSMLMRNDGNGKFEDKTAAFPFVNGEATAAALFAVRGDTAARDVVVSYADHPGVLYRDRLNGRFEASNFPELPAGAAALSIQDFNHDGLLDLVSYRPELRTIINTGEGFAQTKSAKTLPSAVTADFNGDNRADYATISPDGNLHVFFDSSSNQRWMTVAIHGVKNIKMGVGATVEVKSGAYYSKQVYTGVPLPFAADSRAAIDTVRITWPNGLIQNEPRQKIAALNIEEAQRLSGSCPMIFTWNGQKFEFITDVLGVAPLGASSGDGNYFPVNHVEHIQIPGSALKPRDGRYNIHITEELHEVSYLDNVQLVAVDHPSDTAIYLNDKFKSPPYPEFRVFGSEKRIHPLRAIDSHGVDATARLAKIDRTYPDAFTHNSSGVAELHTLDLDFGNAARANKAALVLNGWVDWADGSTFLGASQNGTGLIFPYLQVKDASGRWKTVVEDMGIPSGKPKTIVVDLAGKFLSNSREVRIVTNLCVYWDEIFLIEDSGTPRGRMTPINAAAADVHFRGFSRPVIDPKRQQPEAFLYDQVRPISNWNPTPGLYTRYGDVLPLVQAADDRMVIMGSGDELRLEFPADKLPPLPDGWTRDFFLTVDGWAKDADANTAFSQSVMPLPFHAMSSYPYKPGEHFPDDAAHRQYEKQYLTRPALKLLQPLAPASGGD